MPFPTLALLYQAAAISDMRVTSHVGFSAMTQDQHSIPVEMDVWVKQSSVGRIVAPLRSRTERTQKMSRRADVEVVGAH